MSNPQEFQTAWSELDRALDNVGPLTRRKVALIGGVTHSYKTGLLTNLFYQHCKSPTPAAEGQTPKVLYITVDESSSAIMDRLIELAYRENNLPAPTGERDLAEDDLQFLTDVLNEGGYEHEILVLNPGYPRTIGNLCSLIGEYITDNTDVHAVFIDGLDQIDQQPEADHIEAMKALTSFMAQKDILCVATHQLSYAALKNKASGMSGYDLLNDAYVNTRWVSGGEAIARCVDLEILVDRREDGLTVDVLCGSHQRDLTTPTEPRLVTIALP